MRPPQPHTPSTLSHPLTFSSSQSPCPFLLLLIIHFSGEMSHLGRTRFSVHLNTPLFRHVLGKNFMTYEDRERESERERQREQERGSKDMGAENQGSLNSNITTLHLLWGDPWAHRAAQTTVLMLLYLIHIKWGIMTSSIYTHI